MKKQIKSVFDRKNLKVLTKQERSRIKGGNSSSGSTTNQAVESEIVIEDIIQI